MKERGRQKTRGRKAQERAELDAILERIKNRPPIEAAIKQLKPFLEARRSLQRMGPQPLLWFVNGRVTLERLRLLAPVVALWKSPQTNSLLPYTVTDEFRRYIPELEKFREHLGGLLAPTVDQAVLALRGRDSGRNLLKRLSLHEERPLFIRDLQDFLYKEFDGLRPGQPQMPTKGKGKLRWRVFLRCSSCRTIWEDAKKNKPAAAPRFCSRACKEKAFATTPARREYQQHYQQRYRRMTILGVRALGNLNAFPTIDRYLGSAIRGMIQGGNTWFKDRLIRSLLHGRDALVAGKVERLLRELEGEGVDFRQALRRWKTNHLEEGTDIFDELGTAYK